MKKKFICMAALIIISSFSGCGKNDTPQSTEAPNSESITTTSSTETEEVVSDAPATELPVLDYEDTEEMDLIFSNSLPLTWYTVKDGQMVENVDNENVADEAGEDIINKMIEAGMLIDGTKALSFEKNVISDGISENANGIFEIFHKEGVLNMTPSFTDILNQEDEETQKLILNAISESYKKSYGLDIIDIKCDGAAIMTDYINYDDIVNDEREKLLSESSNESTEYDACYEEFGENE